MSGHKYYSDYSITKDGLMSINPKYNHYTQLQYTDDIEGKKYDSYLKRLPHEFPNTLKNILIYSTNLEFLPTLRNTALEYLCLMNSRKIDMIPELPKTIKKVIIKEYHQLYDLPNLPEGLELLSIEGCPMSRLPKLPNSLKYLSFNNTLIEYIRNELPPNLISLELKNNLRLKNIYKLPVHLKSFDLNGTNSKVKYPDLTPNTSLSHVVVYNDGYYQFFGSNKIN